MVNSFNLGQLLIGLVSAAGIGAFAYWRGALTRSGVVGAILTGTLILGLGGWQWGLLLIAFFASSSLLSFYRDVLVVQLGSDVDLVNTGAELRIRELAAESTPEQSLRRMQAIGRTRGRFDEFGTIAPLLAIESLFIASMAVGAFVTPLLISAFGLQAAINKRLAIITDMRIGSRTDRGTLVSRLLSISGEDHQTIPRKYLDDWEGYLTTRIVIMTNELPQILDVSGALVSRYIVLPMEQSFLGREDLTLTDKLCKQRAGILNWAIAGRQMLTERGRFTQTTAGEEKVRQLRRLTSQVVAFIEDCCRYDAEAKTDKDPLYQAYAFWAADQGLPSLCKEVFCKDLLEISEGRVREYKPWKAEGPRLRSFKGIALAGEPAYPAAASITPVQAVQAGY